MAIKANDSRLLELEEVRRNIFCRGGIASAYAFEPVIPLSVRDRPQEKEPFLPYSRKLRGADRRSLEFGSLSYSSATLFFPLLSLNVYDTFRSLAGALETSESITLHPESPLPLPGIFIAAGTSEELFPAPEAAKPWKSYKLAEYRLEWKEKEGEAWWKNCSWEEVWELSIRRS